MNFTGPVVLHDRQYAHGRQHHRQARPLGSVLAESQEYHHGRHKDEPTAHANKARSYPSEEANGQKNQKG